MTVLEAILSRRTVHSYEPSCLAEAELIEILEAGHFAPNHRLTWPWRFTIMGPEAREELARLAVDVKLKKGALSPKQREGIRDKMLTPAALVVVSQVRSDDDFQSKEDYAAVACALQNIALLCQSRGLGSKWSTGAITRSPELYELARIDFEKEESVGFLWVGEPKVMPKVKRPLFSQVFKTVP
jgi:nitroreductase